ncbi:MAG: UDP-N-acetylmuramate--L-alanine ligase [Oscillospiraceae bacterium]
MTEQMIHILEGKKHIHFIGIGGSGMFPLAQILHAEGYYLTGSDNNETDTLELVRKLGIPVYMGQAAGNIEGADLVVHTAAIMQDNPELIAARQSGVPVLERSELLGVVTHRYSNTVCVSGTHGKTTTTSMLVQILLETDIDPTAVIGGKLPAIGGNGRVGASDVMVCEACEFVDTFLKLYPDISVILNIDADHLDYFGTLENIIKSFRKFSEMTTKMLLVNGDDANTMKAVDGLDKKLVTFGYADTNDYYVMNITHGEGIQTAYDLMKGGDCLGRITIHVPGDHNVINSLAACAAAAELGVDVGAMQAGLEIQRRRTPL